ncbi:hypothetical protein KIW84_030271 [Lathyrus oleraceus]|uniref:Uncharacterized protein n=1 Tax=Pisum sativum TaxID=3888 RepID=A0A9D4XRX6_PEA|nr:hypothetical protein KIW84_030271 [Pisum sativum]
MILGPSLPRTPISVPSLELELSHSLSLSPSSTPESEPVIVPGPSRPSVLQESAPPTPTLVYQRRSTLDLLQKQIQSSEPEVSTENDSSSDDCAISDTCDTNPVDLPIALRKDKRSLKYSTTSSINIAKIIFQEIHVCAKKTDGMLYFPSLNTALCKRHEVPDKPTDDICNPKVRFDKAVVLNLLNAKGIKRKFEASSSCNNEELLWDTLQQIEQEEEVDEEIMVEEDPKGKEPEISNEEKLNEEANSSRRMP